MDDLIPYEIRKKAIESLLEHETSKYYNALSNLTKARRAVYETEQTRDRLDEACSDLRQQYFDLTGEDVVDTW